jgi:uncharacterized protein
VIDARKRV